MNSQTARRPSDPRTRSTKTKGYVKQTAHVEARRDGKPLIFGWGGHLSRHEKVKLQRRAIWTLTSLIALALVAVLISFWVNINVITPGLSITTVNGVGIPQSDYRKLLAVKAQLLSNTLNGPKGLYAQRDDLKKQVDAQQKTIDDTKKQIDQLNQKITALPAGPSDTRSDLEKQLTDAKTKLADAQKQHDTLNGQYNTLQNTTIPLQVQAYSQSPLGSETVQWLQYDVLIRQWLTKQGADVRAKIEPTDAEVSQAIKDLSNNIPKSSNYNKFLNDSKISDSDVHTMMALKVRRDKLQSYLSSQITSPAYQVQARQIVVATKNDADGLLKQLKDQKADFAKLAKDKSVDTNTNSKGGELGWLARGQYAKDVASSSSAVIDNWLFDPARKEGELSSALQENGSYHIVQIEKIDPSRAIDSVMLKELQDNALTYWSLQQKALPGTTIGSIDQDKLTDSNNMPPGLPAGSQVPSAGQGLPGQPDQGQPGQP